MKLSIPTSVSVLLWKRPTQRTSGLPCPYQLPNDLVALRACDDFIASMQKQIKKDEADSAALYKKLDLSGARQFNDWTQKGRDLILEAQSIKANLPN